MASEKDNNTAMAYNESRSNPIENLWQELKVRINLLAPKKPTGITTCNFCRMKVNPRKDLFKFHPKF